ncbi:hypothetical protein BCY84_20440 [Trypanosoma cruzi cruzi]|nr:hypothetical protein BCY84_20440 [Trypanosoma cruzi cruzi]
MKRTPHPSGVEILFDAKWHQYKLGHTALRSVSKVLDKYFPFDEKRVLALVSKKTGQPVEEVKAGWNRQALLGKNIHEYIQNKLCGLPPPTWTVVLKSQQKKKEEEEEPKKRNSGKKKTDVKSPSTSSKKSIVDSVLHGDEAAYMNAADRVIENILRHYDIIAVEQVIASPSWGIGGTVDFIARNKRTHKLLIGDWKTSGSVASAFRFGSFEEPCTGCLMHLPNTKFYRYAMQVIIYGEILKHERYLSDGFFGRAVKPINVAVESISVSPHDLHNAFDYGIVQLLKDEKGGVCVELKGVTESTVLPVDAHDNTFMQLLKDVMRG